MTVAAIVPCFLVRRHILGVVQGLLPYVDAIYVVDDKCPDNSGNVVVQHPFASKVKVLFHAVNQGVGAAVMTGYRAAWEDGFEIFVKVDGDGQMDAARISDLVEPIRDLKADYTKGNRFFLVEDLSGMPPVRLFGNAILSFVCKISTGYWNIMDPTNGFTALHRSVYMTIPTDKISKRYFFESDMLFRLGINRAVVKDVPMQAYYGDEISNLKISKVAFTFPLMYLRNFAKRFFYCYILRDFNLGTIETLVGAALMVFGVIFGLVKWVEYGSVMEATPLGTIMLATLPVILGTQFLLAAVSYDVANVPTETISKNVSLHSTAKTSRL